MSLLAANNKFNCRKGIIKNGQCYKRAKRAYVTDDCKRCGEAGERLLGLSDYLPELETKDFFLLEIATGGIMRGFMTVPCNMWFLMDTKIEAFLKSTLRLYSISDDKIQEAIAFVKGIDFSAAAKMTLDEIFQYLDEQTEKLTAMP